LLPWQRERENAAAPACALRLAAPPVARGPEPAAAHRPRHNSLITPVGGGDGGGTPPQPRGSLRMPGGGLAAFRHSHGGSSFDLKGVSARASFAFRPSSRKLDDSSDDGSPAAGSPAAGSPAAAKPPSLAARKSSASTTDSDGAPRRAARLRGRRGSVDDSVLDLPAGRQMLESYYAGQTTESPPAYSRGTAATSISGGTDIDESLRSRRTSQYTATSGPSRGASSKALAWSREASSLPEGEDEAAAADAESALRAQIAELERERDDLRAQVGSEMRRRAASEAALHAETQEVL